MNRMRGFSLLEVMLAFVLLAVSLGILLAILGGGLSQVRLAGDASEATLGAESLMAELGVLAPIEPGRRIGEFEDGRYRWTLEITEVDDPAPLPVLADRGDAPVPETVGLQYAGAPRLYRVQLDVSWGEPEQERTLHFATLRARLPPATLSDLP